MLNEINRRFKCWCQEPNHSREKVDPIEPGGELRGPTFTWRRSTRAGTLAVHLCAHPILMSGPSAARVTRFPRCSNRDEGARRLAVAARVCGGDFDPRVASDNTEAFWRHVDRLESHFLPADTISMYIVATHTLVNVVTMSQLVGNKDLQFGVLAAADLESEWILRERVASGPVSH